MMTEKSCNYQNNECTLHENKEVELPQSAHVRR